jgi:hypothetical protein
MKVKVLAAKGKKENKGLPLGKMCPWEMILFFPQSIHVVVPTR